MIITQWSLYFPPHPHIFSDWIFLSLMIGIFPDRVNILFIKFELSMLSDRLPGARVGVRKSWVHGPRPGIITGRPNYDTPSHALQLSSRNMDMEKLCSIKGDSGLSLKSFGQPSTCSAQKKSRWTAKGRTWEHSD